MPPAAHTRAHPRAAGVRPAGAGPGHRRRTESYTRQAAAQARRFALTYSELQAGTNRLLGRISWVLVIVGPILLISQLPLPERWRPDVTGTAAGRGFRRTR